MTLPSWNQGPARAAILDFVDRVSEEGGTDFVPPAERVAVLDNDGTLWCERPTYIQALFVFARLRDAVATRPELAAGNSAGDREMLEYTHTGERSSLCLVVNHDDAEREYAYAGTAATNPNAEPILDAASRLGWTVVSMRRDWSRVFAG